MQGNSRDAGSIWDMAQAIRLGQQLSQNWNRYLLNWKAFYPRCLTSNEY